jgi:hypothetical protein
MDSKIEIEVISSQVRKPYLKPQVERICLLPEEAVLGFCKTTGHGGPGDGLNHRCRMPIGCRLIGS